MAECLVTAHSFHLRVQPFAPPFICLYSIRSENIDHSVLTVIYQSLQLWSVIV